jgi:predicted DNA-binding ribbon-helix-helix protein
MEPWNLGSAAHENTAGTNDRAMKRSIRIHGHKTSVSLEDAFWNSLREIAHQRNETVPHLVARIDEERKFANLSSAIRLFVLQYFQDQCASRERVDLALSEASIEH